MRGILPERPMGHYEVELCVEGLTIMSGGTAFGAGQVKVSWRTDSCHDVSLIIQQASA